MNVWRLTKEKARKAGYFFTGKSDSEKLVYEATNSDPWGPANTQMQEIARLSMSYKDYEEIRKALWDRMDDTSEVRYIQKSLLLLEYLLRNGNESFRSDTKMMVGQLQGLTSLHNHQVGEEAALEAVIRKKAADVIQMVNDNDIYKMERDKARKLASVVTSVQGGGLSGMGLGTGGYNDPYAGDFDDPPAKKKAPQPPSEDSSSDEELEFDPRASSQPPQPTRAQNTNQFGGQQVNKPQTFDPFGGTSQNSAPKQQQFDPFGGFQQQPAQKPQQFDVFGGMNTNQPAQAQKPQTFDVFGGAPNKPAPQATPDLFMFDNGPQTAPKPVANDFIDLTTPARNQNTSNQNFGNQAMFGPPEGQQRGPNQMTNQQPAKPKNDFGGLVNLDLKGSGNKGYGKAQAARGGQSFGGF